MKKILVLFVLVFGLMSFAKSDTVTKNDIITNSEVTFESFNLVNSEYVIETNDQAYECTATVFYNGVAVASFTITAINENFIGMACQLAGALAQEYIDEQSKE